ncbi:MAG: spirocyclase AveC family protein [Panacagrimonas sp.]
MKDATSFPAGETSPARDTPGEGSSPWLSPIVCWALLGVCASAFSFVVFGQWLLSAEHFATVPITPADAMSGNGVLVIRIVEVISAAVAIWALFHWLIRPWMRTGAPSIQGLLLIGALISYVLDTMVNYGGYWMAWNKHAVNWGTWAAFFPGHIGPTQYAEALLWGPPMYLYFGIALATIMLKLIDGLRPRLGFAAAFVIAFIAAFVFDLVAESTIIRAEAYAWPSTVGWLTLWAGSQFQFPLYESLLVACYASFYMLLLESARDHGLSFIERGLDRIPGTARLPVRLLAATGFASACTLFYFGSFVLISLNADNTVILPPYMMYVDP